MNKRGIRLITAVVTSSMIVTPVLAAPSVDDLKKEKAAKQSEVSSLQSQLTTLMGKVNTLESELIQTGEDITKAQGDLEVAQEKEKEQYAAMKKRIKYMYEAGNDSAFETLVTSEDFTDLLSKAEYVQNVHSYDRKQLQEYIDTKQQIADLKAQLEEDQANLESMQSDYENEQTTLSNTLESKREEVANLDEQLQAAVAAAEAKRQAEEAAKAAKAAEAASKSNTATASTNNSGSQTASNATASNNNNNNSNNTVTETPSAPSTPSTPSTPAVTPSTPSYSGNGNAILSAAAAYLGVPYVWGGTSASGVDCSGLVYLAHQACGISITRNSYSQGSGGQAVSDPQPGDVVCYGGHVGIYAGGGQMIHAPQPGEVVCYTSVDYAYHWYRRYW